MDCRCRALKYVSHDRGIYGGGSGSWYNRLHLLWEENESQDLE